MKFLLDQTVGSVMNIGMFIALINLLKGEGVGRTWVLVCEVCLLFLCFDWTWYYGLSGEANHAGLSSYYGCTAKVSACCLDTDVYRRACGPTSSVWECLWCDLGGISELICRCLTLFILFLYPFLVCFYSIFPIC